MKIKIKFIIYILTIFIVGCNSEKNAVRILKLSPDSEYASRTDTIIIESHKFDTLTRYNHDTITINNDRVWIKVERDTINNIVRIRGECKEIIKTVPVEVIKFVNKEKEPPIFMAFLLYTLIGLAFLTLIYWWLK